jgi:hypothetical protein
MRPGESCLTCHGAKATAVGRAQHHTWTMAGTVFDEHGDTLEGALVLLTDAAGHKLSLTTNGGGNFYTAEPIDMTAPLPYVAVEYHGHRLQMPLSNTPANDCNSCHTPVGRAGSQISIPTN